MDKLIEEIKNLGFSNKKINFIFKLGLFIFQENEEFLLEEYKDFNFNHKFQYDISNNNDYKNLLRENQNITDEINNLKLEIEKNKQIHNTFIQEKLLLEKKIKFLEDTNNNLEEQNLQDIRELKHKYNIIINEETKKTEKLINDKYIKQINNLQNIIDNYNLTENNYKNTINSLKDKNNDLIKQHLLEIKHINQDFQNNIKQEKNILEDKLKNDYDNKIKELKLHIENINNHYTSQNDFLKTQITTLNKDKENMSSLFTENLKKEVETQIASYKETNIQLTNEIKRMKDLYEDSNKGKFYEKELIPLFEDANDKITKNKWKIEHIGSNISEKGDFIFQNKDTGDIIILDSKNSKKNCTVRTEQVIKFKRDVDKPENNCIGGILLSSSNIAKKSNCEIEYINGKPIFYVCNFQFDNINFIFTILEHILLIHKQNNNNINLEDLKRKYISDYKFVKERINTNNSEAKKLNDKLNEIINDYKYKFNKDIQVVIMDNNKIKHNKIKEPEKETITDDFYTDLEKDKHKIIGKRNNKYYLIYKNNDDDILQYFPCQSKLNKKIQDLKKKDDDNIILLDI